MSAGIRPCRRPAAGKPEGHRDAAPGCGVRGQGDRRRGTTTAAMAAIRTFITGLPGEYADELRCSLRCRPTLRRLFHACQRRRPTVFLLLQYSQRDQDEGEMREGVAMTPPRAGGCTNANGDGKITQEAVLTAALDIIDRDGADGLSMRRLARALGRDPMILYRHAQSKAALLDDVVEMVLDRLTVDATDPDWAGQLRAVARRYRDLALAHPHVVPLLVTRPLATPLALRPHSTLRPLEDVLKLLTRAGFSGPDALHIYRALFGFLHGHVLNELQEIVDNPDETDDLLRLGLHRLPIGDFPLLRGLAPVLAAYDGAAELERGLDILLTGLTTTLTPIRPGSPAGGE